MEKPVSPDPALPQRLDEGQFRRVWARVMPEDRPDCPFVLSPLPPPSPAPAAEGTPPGPEVFWVRALEHRRVYLALSGPCRPLAREKARQAGRLRAAFYLMAGRWPALPPLSAPERLSFPAGVRQMYHAETSSSRELLAASAIGGELGELYRQLGEEDRLRAQRLRAILEEFSISEGRLP